MPRRNKRDIRQPIVQRISDRKLEKLVKELNSNKQREFPKDNLYNESTKKNRE